MDVNTWAGSGSVLYLVIAVALLAESTIVLGLVAPGVSAFVLGAFVAGAGGLSPPIVWIIGFLSVVAGDNIGFALGVLGRRSRRIASFLHRAGLNDEQTQRITPLSVFYQFPVVTRAPMPVYFGLRGLAWWRFMLLNLLASAMFVTTLFFPAYFTGRAAGSLDEAQQVAVTVQYIFLALAAGWIVYIVTRLVRRRNRHRATVKSAQPLDESAHD